MSAESSRRLPRKGSAGQVVLPQPVIDPSLIDSVTGFIQDVVPQAYTGNTGDSRETITWVRVQQADVNDPVLYPDTGEQDGVPPLLLVLGYGSGVQVWVVPASGEAREVLSWSQGSVRTLCVLPSPEPRLPLRQDLYRHKRPLVAMVDNAGPGPQFCSVSFISLRDGDQVKSIKFSHQVWDVVANRRSVVVSLAERIAVFDAATLEDNMVVTTCYPNPDVNPVALGTRWLAYADRRLVSQWRSLGGCHSEGPQSVTATVFHAAKFLGKGLRDLSETVASSLTGGSPENTHFHHAPHGEPTHKGVVTILDIEGKVSKEANEEDHPNKILAHFNAHHEPIVALSFDPSGTLLVSADKRGHRFHLFRINTHPCTSTLAYVQHLYILHRGDTTARIQDIAFSADSRWVAISSMRGTTHVFPITPYGGTVGVRTHTTPHVVNKLSRFHRSAGLTDDGRNSPVLWESPPGGGGHPAPPVPTTVTPLAQVRRQSALAPPTEDSIVKVAAVFGAPRAPSLPAHNGGPRARRSMDSIYIMACNGALVQYDLDPRHLSGVSKEKVCDDTGIELHVEAKAQWLLQRPPYSSALHPPLACTNPLLSPAPPDPPTPTDPGSDDERWLSQVEIVTHAGPHRRLWMGPQFTFITVSSNNEAGDALDINKQVVRSNPVNMPLKQPLIIESGSCSSLELSPNMVELVYKTDCSWSCRLREDLAEAMLESPATRNTGGHGGESFDDLSLSSYDSASHCSPSPSPSLSTETNLVFPADTL